jgi:hypothetical protein
MTKQMLILLSAAFMLFACETAFDTQSPKWTRDNVNVYRSPATDENVAYSIIDSGVKQMSEGPQQKIKPEPYNKLRVKR